MSKYRHLPTGDIYSKRTNGYYSDHQHEFVPIDVVEKTNSQDWEKVVEHQKEYQILAFRSLKLGILAQLQEDSSRYLYAERRVAFPIDRLLEIVGTDIEENVEIYSVRRLSDGQKFQLGQTITYNNGTDLEAPLTIAQFEIDNENGLSVKFKEEKQGSLNHIFLMDKNLPPEKNL